MSVTPGYVDNLRARIAELEAEVRALRSANYMKLVHALAAVCERGDTDHSAKSMYWIASDALKAAGFNSQGAALTPNSGEAK